MPEASTCIHSELIIQQTPEYLMRSAAISRFSSNIPGFISQHDRHFSKILDFACAERRQNQGF